MVMRRAIAAACSSVAPKISSRWKLPGFLRTSSTFAFIWSSRDLRRFTSVCVDSTRRSSSRISAVTFCCSVAISASAFGGAIVNYRSPVLYPALPDRVDDRLRAVVHRQFAQDARHVILHRLLGDGQRVGDLLVRHALSDVVQDLHLTGRKRREDVRRPRTIHGKLAELSEHLGRHRRPAEDLLVDDELAATHFADRIDELGGL